MSDQLPQCNKHHIGEQSSQKNCPLNLQKQIDPRNGWIDFPVDRRWEEKHNLCDLGQQKHVQQHANKGSKCFDRIHIESVIIHYKVDYHHCEVRKWDHIVSSVVELSFLIGANGVQVSWVILQEVLVVNHIIVDDCVIDTGQ